VLTGALFAFAWYHFSPHDFVSILPFAKAAIVLAVCIVVFVIDFEHYLILDKVVLPASVLMVLFAIALHAYGNIFAGIVGFIPFWFIWYISKGKWMGFGDAKFAAFMGLVLGLPSLVVALFLSFGIGALVGILLIFAGKKDLGSKLPFGTFLTISTILALFYGQKLWDLYMSLL
jgi:leader peptidase (prepilin peptidase)/N-methyltransferase